MNNTDPTPREFAREQTSNDSQCRAVAGCAVAPTGGDLERALARCEEFLSRYPCDVDELAKRGEIKRAIGDFDGAYKDLESALAIVPSHQQSRYSRCQLDLLLGNWARGWEFYESRWQTESFKQETPRARGIKQWDGTNAKSLKVLVWGEQGIGDQIQFASQITDLLALGVEPVIEVDPRLVPLFRRSFPCPVYGFDEIPASVLKDVACQSALASLGGHLRRSERAFEPRNAFLTSDGSQMEQLREKYTKLARGKPIIGIAWSSMNPVYGPEKSIPLEMWTNLLTQFPAFYVSVQYGEVATDVQASPADIWVDDGIDQLTDIDSAAAQLGAVDLVISISNSAVHIAGAMGKEAWVVVPKIPEWRWGAYRSDSLWYPNVKISRQPERDDWSNVLSNVRSKLVDKFNLHTKSDPRI